MRANSLPEQSCNGHLDHNPAARVQSLETSGGLSYPDRRAQALRRAAIRVQNARTPEEVFQQVSAQLHAIGLQCACALMGEGEDELVVKHISMPLPLLAVVERMLAARVVGSRIRIDQVSALRVAVHGRRAVFTEGEVAIHDTFPEVPAARVRQVVELTGARGVAVVPLLARGQAIGTLTVWADNLVAEDLSPLARFAQKVGTTFELEQTPRNPPATRSSVRMDKERLYRNPQREIRSRDDSLPTSAHARNNLLCATPLTLREREVAMLVACGLTNRQIAEALVITEKTAEAHVGHILDKLGLTSRAQVAAWTLSNAQRAIRARDESVAHIAHDLKNPLTAIRAGAQVLEHYASPEDGEQLRAGLAAIQASATKMGVLLDDLLNVARPGAPRPEKVRRRPTDLVALARETAANHQQAAPRHRIRVETSEPELVGRWDTARLERVLDNLLGNATRYSPEGGQITVSISREPDYSGAWAILAVWDQGVGIPAADLPHIFEPFRRGSNVTGRMSGTGIGLTGARRMVEQHGGTITVASRENAGTTVTVRLPLLQQAEGGQAVAA